MFALVDGGVVKFTAPEAERLAHMGPGAVVELTGATALAATHGYALEVVAGAVVESLPGAKARLWAQVKARREVEVHGGCDTALGRVDTKGDSRQRIHAAVSTAQLALGAGQPFSVDWTMADNSEVTHDAQAMIAMGLAAADHVASIHATSQALRAAIDAAETAEALAAIDIDAGWPGQ